MTSNQILLLVVVLAILSILSIVWYVSYCIKSMWRLDHLPALCVADAYGEIHCFTSEIPEETIKGPVECWSPNFDLDIVNNFGDPPKKCVACGKRVKLEEGEYELNFYIEQAFSNEDGGQYLVGSLHLYVN